MQFERRAQYGGDRRQRDVALVPGQAHAQHLLALPVAHAHGADVRNGTGIGARFRAGQREARDLVAARRARQVVVFLFFGAVVLQQFARAEGVRHADGDRRDARNAGQFCSTIA